MAKYRMYKNTNVKSAGYNKFYARKASQGLVTLDMLIEHMAGHNTAYSKGIISGVITDLVECTRELAYEGKAVKIPNLGIFSVSMKSKGVTDPTKFNPQTDIASKWQVQPTGAVLAKGINVTRAGGALISWEEVGNYQSPRTQNNQATGG